MDQAQIGPQRLVSQQVAAPDTSDPAEVVRRLGAVQAQDYLACLWAVGLRTVAGSEGGVERALAEGRIIRTWPMRGTIHMLAPADARWMLELLTPRVVQGSQGRLRQLGLDAATIAAGAKVITGALEGGRQLTRGALYALLEEAGISAEGQRGYHILTQLAYEQLICFGAREGKQPTFALLDDLAPNAPSLPRDEALATLALRYFTSHGPATIQDFVWWSGLSTADARDGLHAVAARLAHEQIAGQSYYAASDAPVAPPDDPQAFLLPPFDEFLIAYRDRSASLDPAYNHRIVPGGNGIFNPIMVIGGRVLGTWKRTLSARGVKISFSPFAPLADGELHALAAAAEQYGHFLGLPVKLEPPA
jgi:Winged helix DNA-binding domain